MVNVILVDDDDKQIWVCEKLAAHTWGWKLHRAFSVYIINDDNELLIQQRAETKYHCPGLFANTCCSHQREGELNIDAAHRRLQEEMWFDNSLEKIVEFVYKVDVPPQLTEYEYLHVFLWKYQWAIINPDPEEVSSYKRVSFDAFDMMVKNDDQTLATWTKITWWKLKDTIMGYE
jgi:isopentenyl-diphosphate delta-isomerase